MHKIFTGRSVMDNASVLGTEDWGFDSLRPEVLVAQW